MRSNLESRDVPKSRVSRVPCSHHIGVNVALRDVPRADGAATAKRARGWSRSAAKAATRDF